MPTTKVTAGGIGGALATVVVWAVSLFGVDVPAEVAAAVATIFGFALAYIVPENKPESGTLHS